MNLKCMFVLFIIPFNNISTTSVLILVGPPGSGEGHISQILKEDYDFCHISAGDLLRNVVRERVDGYEDISAKLAAGLPVDNKIMHNLLRIQVQRYINENKNIIIDGFGGQSANDVPFLYNLLNENNLISMAKVLYLVSCYEKCIERMNSRIICSSCARVYNKQMLQQNNCVICGGELMMRSGDDINAIKKRLDRYNKVMKKNYEQYKTYISYVEFNADDKYDMDDIVKCIGICE